MSQQDEDDVIAQGESKCVAAQIDTSTEVNEESWDPLTCTETHNYICEVAAGTPVYIYVPPLEQYCPDGWDLDQDFCYLVSSNEMTWSSAESFCQTAGGHLASINSWIEQDTVHNHLGDTSWIGLNDRRVDGVFEWSDGNAVVIQNWNMGDPSGGDENCVEMKIEEGFWNDMTCSEAQPFVCKRGYSTTPLGPVTTTTPAPDSGSCGEGWEEDSTSGICYMFVNELLAQADARLRCQEMPYSEGQSVPDLTSLSNEDEQLFVEGMVARARVQDHGVYIGLRNDDTSLYWTDGEPVAILNYADGEPNGFSSDSCTEMLNDGKYEWNDCDCKLRLPFVCEKKGLDYKSPTPPPILLECPAGWKFFNEFCYYISSSSELKNWSDARGSCADMYGSSLTSIMSEDENKFILDSIQDDYKNTWIGLIALDNGSYTSWVDGNLITYTNWYPGEPNNQFGLEDCVGMMYSYAGAGQGQWDDMPCDNIERYVCKTQFKTCPEGWSLHDNKCYYISTISETWDIALDKCREVEGDATLLSWHSQQEVDYVQGLINDSIDLTWLGLRLEEGEAWKWTDGSADDFVNWRPGQPDHNDTELCALTDSNPESSNYGYIDNYPCNGSHHFACEYFPNPTVGCDPGWEFYGGYCYYDSQHKEEFSTLKYDEASAKCQEFGGHLTSILSADENNFLYSHLDVNYYYYHHIGLKVTAPDGKLTWSDGSPVLYTSFSSVISAPTPSSNFYLAQVNGLLWTQYNYLAVNYYFCKKSATITSLVPPSSGRIS
ncbi:macrophage mannose receptor 1 [Hyalella azteca]|uniref:Macrophage mannose receptor 1 n=1 Tax=Hyalella azteca TaxID=294128 RepID=A0A8B7NTH3_HYAAZ|nr:macrophage mannose receptor 1 [Hyalella azteca]